MIDFAATEALDDAALRALLAGGAPEERVWAAWRIALRRGTAMPEIIGAVRGEPSAGVRRALLPVLVGHGELDVVVALARHDPSDEVRAAAMPFVVRLAGQGAIPVEVIRDALAAGVRVDRAILAAIPAGAPSPLGFVIVRALAHGTRDEMLDAFEAALRIGARAAAMRWLAATRGALAEEARARLAAFDREPA